MGPRRRLVLLLASVRDASRRTAKSAVCSAGEFMSLLSSHGPWSGSGCTMPPHNSACCMVRSSSIPGICTAGAQGACLGGTRCLSTASIGPFRALPHNAHLASCPQLLQLQRGFASGDLPPHIEMEMPALSPTMSQVRNPVLSALPNLLRGFCMLQELEAHGGVPCLKHPPSMPCIASSQADGVLRWFSKSCRRMQGNIASWKKSEGEEFAAGDVLAEIETDKVRLQICCTVSEEPIINQSCKSSGRHEAGMCCYVPIDMQATMDWEAQDEGVIAKILAPDGSKDIPVGTVVAVVVEDAEHVGPHRAPCRTVGSLACMAQQDVGLAASLVWSVVMYESPSLSSVGQHGVSEAVRAITHVKSE